MSDFMSMITDMLPTGSELHNPDNLVRKVLDNSVGAYMDAQDDILEDVFLDSATGGWLDAFGRDYDVVRRLDESDESYRERIIFEKLEYLTAHNLQEVYGLILYALVADFDATDNMLTSDNPYNSTEYMSIAPADLQETINNKFILDGGITWL